MEKTIPIHSHPSEIASPLKAATFATGMICFTLTTIVPQKRAGYQGLLSSGEMVAFGPPPRSLRFP